MDKGMHKPLIWLVAFVLVSLGAGRCPCVFVHVGGTVGEGNCWFNCKKSSILDDFILHLSTPFCTFTLSVNPNSLAGLTVDKKDYSGVWRQKIAEEIKGEDSFPATPVSCTRVETGDKKKKIGDQKSNDALQACLIYYGIRHF